MASVAASVRCRVVAGRTSLIALLQKRPKRPRMG